MIRMQTHNLHTIKTDAILRLHKSPVCALEPFYLPSPFIANGEFVLQASLVSADEDGWVVWWDLGSKRPLGMWKAHESTIVTVQQMGIRWEENVPQLHQRSFGKLLTHGRDNCLRIWDLFKVISFSSMEWNLCKVLHKTPGSAQNPDVYEIPVNAMNFCNVAAKAEMIATPASLASENFDIYIVNGQRLVRLHSNIDTWELSQQKHHSIKIDNTRNFGAIMKMIWAGDFRLVVGYESGHVICIQLSEEDIQVAWINESHLKYPILGMATNLDRCFTCSVSDRIVVIDLNTGHTVASSKINHKGISNLDVIIKNNICLVALTTWDGFSRIYRYAENLQSTTNALGAVFIPWTKLKRVSPNVFPNLKGSSDHQPIDPPDMKGRIIKLSRTQSGLNDASLKRRDGQSKMILRRSDKRVLAQWFVFVGYNDGRVATYILGDDPDSVSNIE